MIWTKTKRVARSGFVSFWRNGFVSVASILVITLSLFVFEGLIFFSLLTNSYLDEVKDKVDVNVYFETSADEEDILSLKSSLEALPEVERVEYVSRDEALTQFRARHEGDALTIQGLDELGENPLPAVLNIKAKQPSQYGSVAKFLEGKNALSADGATIIESVNYNKNKVIIDRLAKIISASERAGLALAVIMIVIAVMVTFNTIRLAIYSAREEVSVMKLVGASNMYIRGPFVVSGIMYGVISAIVTLIVFYPIAYYGSEFLSSFGAGVNLHGYYISNFGQIFLIVMGSGIGLGALSSFLAVKRYLNV